MHEPVTDEPALEITIDRRRLSHDKQRVKTRARQVSLTVLDPRGTVREQR